MKPLKLYKPINVFTLESIDALGYDINDIEILPGDCTEVDFQEFARNRNVDLVCVRSFLVKDKWIIFHTKNAKVLNE